MNSYYFEKLIESIKNISGYTGSTNTFNIDNSDIVNALENLNINLNSTSDLVISENYQYKNIEKFMNVDYVNTSKNSLIIYLKIKAIAYDKLNFSVLINDINIITQKCDIEKYYTLKVVIPPLSRYMFKVEPYPHSYLNLNNIIQYELVTADRLFYIECYSCYFREFLDLKYENRHVVFNLEYQNNSDNLEIFYMVLKNNSQNNENIVVHVDTFEIISHTSNFNDIFTLSFEVPKLSKFSIYAQNAYADFEILDSNVMTKKVL